MIVVSGDEELDIYRPGVQTLILGPPLKIRAAYSRRDSATGSDKEYHFLVITSGEHEIVIRSSPHGQTVKLFLDGSEVK
jgi:hypothetical protein